MCFWKQSLFIPLRKRKAKKDITCFKFLIQTDKGELITPFALMPVMIGETYNTTLQSQRLSGLDKWWYPIKYYHVDIGMHSYKNSVYCLENMGGLSLRNPKCRYIRVLCVIPKGSYYYENDDEYVSSSIRYIKFIDP